MAASSSLVVVLIFLCLFSVSFSDDKQALLDFISAVRHESRINWNSSSSHCSWTGVFCDSGGADRVRILRLPAVGLVGEIPAKTIGNLTELRVISLHTNKLSGGIPQDFANLKFLRSLYLQNNEFTGEFPSFLPELTRLTRVDLSNNQFSGKLPFAINNLTELTGLFLQNNAFSGVIPSIDITGMTGFNISNNKLNGSIPPTLQRFPESAFSGNLQLCGPPLAVSCTPFFPSPISPSGGGIIGRPAASHHAKLSRTAIIAIAVVAASVLLILLILILFLLISRRRKQGDTGTIKGQSRGVEIGGSSSLKDEYMGGGAQEVERNKLVFFNGIKGGGSGGGYNFDLDDLLRASAEVLGKGSVGTSYKAVLEDGTTVVVKRLKDVSVGKKEFEGVLESLGGAQHSNLVPLRAYYYSKDEKLLVLDYLATGSLSAMLHGSRGSGRTPLDWDSRMKIAVHTARGLAYLHEDAKVVHGNIKSSNILLRQDHGACVSDFGLQPLFSSTSSTPSASRVAGYRAPEVMETRKVTFKSDIYSFGVLLLEVLTGKSPNQASLNDQGVDLPRWVQSVVREEWTAEVFDVDLMRYQNIEEEMVQLLQIAMACVATMPDQRPSIHDVLRMIEDINRVDTDDGGMRHSSDDKSKGSESHATPSEVRTPPSTATP